MHEIFTSFELGGKSCMEMTPVWVRKPDAGKRGASLRDLAKPHLEACSSRTRGSRRQGFRARTTRPLGAHSSTTCYARARICVHANWGDAEPELASGQGRRPTRPTQSTGHKDDVSSRAYHGTSGLCAVWFQLNSDSG